VPSVLNDRNVPLRLALAAAGFRAAGAGTPEPQAGSSVVFRRMLAGPLPVLPGWLTGPAGPAEPGPDQPLPRTGGTP